MRIPASVYNTLKSAYKDVQDEQQPLESQASNELVNELHQTNQKFLKYLDNFFKFQVEEGQSLKIKSLSDITKKFKEFEKSITNSLEKLIMTNTSFEQALFDNSMMLKVFYQFSKENLESLITLMGESNLFSCTLQSEDPIALEKLKPELPNLVTSFEELIPSSIKNNRFLIVLEPNLKGMFFGAAGSNLNDKKEIIKVAEKKINGEFKQTLVSILKDPLKEPVIIKFDPKAAEDESQSFSA